MKNQATIKRILIVDDDELSSGVFAERLQKRGFWIKTITNGNLAMELIKNERINLVLLDIMMPDLDGISLLKQIRTQYSLEQVPVIMVTVLDESADIFDAFEAGANDYITKPVNIDAAASRISGLLSVAELSVERSKKMEIQAINALVVTYHHEINNPLAIARSEFQSMLQEHPNMDQESIRKIYASFDRIAVILQKIQEIAEKNEISYELYANTSKMIKIKEDEE